jgi:hypothetical protein
MDAQSAMGLLLFSSTPMRMIVTGREPYGVVLRASGVGNVLLAY